MKHLSKSLLTPRSVQTKISAQIIKECPLPLSTESLSSFFDKFVSMITPSDDQQRVAEENIYKATGFMQEA